MNKIISLLVEDIYLEIRNLKQIINICKINNFMKENQIDLI
jgi:hypothetical protein